MSTLHRSSSYRKSVDFEMKIHAEEVVSSDVSQPKEVVIDVLPSYQQHGESKRAQRTSIAVRGPKLAFDNIGYTVMVKKQKVKTPKAILKGVSGVVKGGEVMYIMGPSGAGKSTMLDALAGRLKGDVTGSVTLDGETLKTNQLHSIAKYVQQEDVHIPVLTVDETLFYAALMYTEDKGDARSRVDETIEVLGLASVRNTRAGNFLLRGLSGGQKRRLSVGVELVAKPRILFLDEPTSGLDSTSAFAVISSLTQIAESAGTTMVISIHQPAERLFLKANCLLLLTEGQAAFCGGIREAVPYFGTLGYIPPPMTSSSEFLLDLVNSDFTESPQVVHDICSKWDQRPKVTTTAIMHVDVIGPEFHTGFFHNVSVLSQRMFYNSLRNPLVIWLRMGLYLALSIMIGTVWLRIGADNPKASVVPDLVGALFFIAAFMVFMSVSVLPAFCEEKAVFVKERANGMYRVSAYNLAHFIIDIPFVLLLAVVCGSITYWLVGFNPDAGAFFFFLVDLFLSFMVAESIMILIASMVPDAIIGIAGGAMIYGGMMVVQGFFIKIEEIGWWWRWMHYVGMHTYSFAGFLDNEFRGRDFGADATADGGPVANRTGYQILQMYDVEDTEKWWNMLVLVAMIVIYRLMAFFHMYYKHTGKH